MAVDTNTALLLVKTRLNRLATDTSLDEYLTFRIQGAEQELNAMMRCDLTDSTADLLLLTDYTVWQYQNRDKPAAQPAWLRQRLRERFLKREEDDLP